jgi:putative FmdB family regulatory protein
MPTYTYHCETCEDDFDDLVPLANYQEPQACPVCDTLSPRTMGTFPGTIFRGDGWSSKNNRIAGQMKVKNERLKAKEREQKGDGMIPSLAPNVGGEKTGSWAEASKLAKSKGKDTSGYDQLARKETKSA